MSRSKRNWVKTLNDANVGFIKKPLMTDNLGRDCKKLSLSGERKNNWSSSEKSSTNFYCVEGTNEEESEWSWVGI